MARLRKLAAAAAGSMGASQEATALPVVALGAAVVLCRHLAFRPNMEELGSSITPDEAHDALAAHGMSEGECSFALSALQAAQVAALSCGVFTFPVFERELETHLRTVTNRVAGWDKRLGVTEVKPSRPALGLVHSAASVPAAAPVKRGTPKSAAKRSAVPGSNHRFSAADSAQQFEDDAVVIRIRAKCGGVAEITRSYIDQLKAVFPRLDVEGQIRIAGNWSESNSSRRKTLRGMPAFLNGWLTRADGDASVRAAVARAARQGNGFGHGGTYEAPEADVAMRAEAAPDEFDDLLSSESLAAPVAATSVAPVVMPVATPVVKQPSLVQVPVSKVSSVMAARARLPVNVAPRVAQPQRRLSEQRS